MENKTNTNFIIPTALAVVLAIGLWVGNTLSTNGTTLSASGGAAKHQKLQDIIDVLDKKYVDTLNGEALFEQTISDMLHKLDPHSNYIPAKELARANEPLQGNFEGIGISFNMLTDTILCGGTSVVPATFM